MAAATFPIPYDPPDRKGFDKLRRGAAEEGMPPDEPLWNYRRLIARVGSAPAWIWVMHYRAGPYGSDCIDPDITELLGTFHRSLKWVLDQFRILIDAGVWSPYEGRPGCFKAHPEKIAVAPDMVRPIAPGRGRKPMGHAEVLAPVETAALEVRREATSGGVIESTPGNIFPEPGSPGEPADQDNRMVECPVCHGSGYISVDRPPDPEIYFPPGEMQIAPAENDFRRIAAIGTKHEATGGLKKLVEFKEVKKQAMLAVSDPTEGQLDYWISRQEWGRIDSTRRRGLSDEESRPVIDRIHAGGKRVEHFVFWLNQTGVTISAERTNITGLLIRLVDKMLAFARPYPADRRPLDRSGGPPGEGIE
jgi:hypothetical protein